MNDILQKPLELNLYKEFICSKAKTKVTVFSIFEQSNST